MLGDRTGALSDALKAIEVDAKNPYGYLIAAELYDEMGEKTQAQEYFKKLYAVEKDALGRIPDEYLEAVDKRAYEKRMMEKKKAREAHEKELREQLDKKSRPTDGSTD